MRHLNLTLAYFAVAIGASSAADPGRASTPSGTVKRMNDNISTPEGSSFFDRLAYGAPRFVSPVPESIERQKNELDVASRRFGTLNSFDRSLDSAVPPPLEVKNHIPVNWVPSLDDHQNQHSNGDADRVPLGILIHDARRPQAPSVVAKHSSFRGVGLFESLDNLFTNHAVTSPTSDTKIFNDRIDGPRSPTTANDISNRLTELGLGDKSWSPLYDVRSSIGEAAHLHPLPEYSNLQKLADKGSTDLNSGPIRDRFLDQVQEVSNRVIELLNGTSDEKSDPFGIRISGPSIEPASQQILPKSVVEEKLAPEANASPKQGSIIPPTTSNVYLSNDSTRPDGSGENEPIDSTASFDAIPQTSEAIQSSRNHALSDSVSTLSNIVGPIITSAYTNSSYLATQSGAGIVNAAPRVTSFYSAISLNISIGFPHVLTTTATVTRCELKRCFTHSTVTGVITRTNENVVYVTYCPLPTHSCKSVSLDRPASHISSSMTEPSSCSTQAHPVGRALGTIFTVYSSEAAPGSSSSSGERLPFTDAEVVPPSRAVRYLISSVSAQLGLDAQNHHTTDLLLQSIVPSSSAGHPVSPLYRHESSSTNELSYTSARIRPPSPSKGVSAQRSAPLRLPFEGGSQTTRLGLGAILVGALALC